MTDREIVELVNQCGKRVCSTDEHHGCPFGDEGMVDCVERLEAAYDETIRKLLELSDAQNEGRVTVKERNCGTCRWCGSFAGICANRESRNHMRKVKRSDSCEHWIIENQEETTC